MKSVYHAEEILASGVPWHKECFKCGGAGELGCQRKLNLYDFTLESAVPFCKSCYMRMISKPALVTESTVTGATSGSDRTEITDTQGHVKNSERRMSFGNTNKGGAVNAVTAGMTKLACPKCSKAVYKSEEITLAGFSWHKSCFTCGGTTEENGCRKKLTQNDFHSYRGNPFCKSCVVKQPTLDKKRADLCLTRSESGTSADEDATIGPDATPAPASSTFPKEGATDTAEKKTSAVTAHATTEDEHAAVAAVPAVSTIVSPDGKESDRSNLLAAGGNDDEEKDEDADDGMTTYQDEDGVPCTKDGEPLRSPDATAATMEPVMELLGSLVFSIATLVAHIYSSVFFFLHIASHIIFGHMSTSISG